MMLEHPGQRTAGASGGGEKAVTAARAADSPAAGLAMIVSVMGAKGGVGTTTIAMNIAASLAARSGAILAEFRPSLGSLQGHFHPGRMVRGLASLAEPGTAARSVLWPVPGVAGMRILFGPQTAAECQEFSAGQTLGILSRLSEEARFVVLDLPVSFGEANRAVLGESQYLALVVEPTPVCVRMSKATLEGIQSWDKAPASIGAVVVKRRSEGVTLPLAEVEAELGIPILKVIPPAPALCVAGEQAHMPMQLCDPESLAADSLKALGHAFHSGGSAWARK
jgi:pilus assembly protein CpaE